MADDLEIKLSADATGVKAGMSEAREGVDAGAAGMEDAMAKFTSALADSTAEIKAAFASIGSSAAKAQEETEAHMGGLAGSVKEKLHGVKEDMEGVEKLFTSFSAVLAGGFIGEQLFEMVKGTAELGDQLLKTGQKTGITVENLSKLKYAANLSDVSFEALQQSLGFLARNMQSAAQGSQQQEAAFKSLGISVAEANGSLRPSTEVLGELADKFSHMEDGTGKAALAMQIFGRAGAQMIPLLDGGREGLKAAADEAEHLGIVMSTEAAEASEKLNDDMKRVQAAGKGVTQQILQQLMPAFSSLAHAMVESSQEGGALNSVFFALGATLKAFFTLVEGFIFAVESAFQLLKAAFNQFVTFITAGAAIISDALRGDWAAVKRDGVEASKSIVDGWSEAFERIQNGANETSHSLAEMWGLAEEGPKKAEEGEKKDAAPKPKSLKSEQSFMGKYEAELSAQKLAFEEMQVTQETAERFSIQKEIAFWKTKLATVAAGSKDAEAIRKKIADLSLGEQQKEFETKLAKLHADEAAVKSNSAARIAVVEHEAMLTKQRYGEASPQYEAAQKHLTEVTIEEANKRTEAEMKSAIAASKLQETQIDDAISRVKQKESLGILTHNAALAEEQKYEGKRLALQEAAVRQEIAIAKTDPYYDPEKLRALYAQLEQVHAAGMKKISDIQRQQITPMQALFKSVGATLESSMTSAISGVIKGTMSMHQALMSVLSSVADMAIQTLVKIGVQKLISAALGTASDKATGIAEIGTNAAVAGSGAYAATAAIPFVGPAMAPAAAATAYSGAMAFMAGLSARNGFDIPAGVDPVVQLHQREMVLPQRQADVIRDMADNGGGSGRQINLTLNAMDAHGVKRFLMDNGPALAAALQKHARMAGV